MQIQPREVFCRRVLCLLFAGIKYLYFSISNNYTTWSQERIPFGLAVDPLLNVFSQSNQNVFGQHLLKKSFRNDIYDIFQLRLCNKLLKLSLV